MELKIPAATRTKLAWCSALEKKGGRMDSKTWEKIKEDAKKAHPLARIRKLHSIINDRRIPLKIREEAKELAKKARIELDSEQFWKWGGGSVIPTSRQTPQLEESVREEPRARKSLEETVEGAAPNINKENNNISAGKYSSGSGDKYLSQGYFSKTAYEKESKPEENRESSREDMLATASEKLTKSKYHR